MELTTIYRRLKKHAPTVTMDRLALLQCIESSDTPTMADISAALHISPAAITGAIDRLQELGYVQRRDVSGDRRKKQIAITPSGIKLLRDTLKA